jgi:hypothetical protein
VGGSRRKAAETKSPKFQLGEFYSKATFCQAKYCARNFFWIFIIKLIQKISDSYESFIRREG